MWNFYVLKWANSCPILKSFEQFSRASKHNNPVMRLSPCSQVFKSSASRDTHSSAAIILISGLFSGECCQLRVISGMGDLDDVYSLKAEVADKPEEICVDGCVYTRWDLHPSDPYLTLLLRANASNSGEEYCFKNEQSSGSLECQVRTQFNYFKTGVLCFL